jgi:hypothetical protein
MFETNDFSYAPVNALNALGVFFNGNDMDVAGVPWLDDLIIAVAIVNNGVLTSEPNAYFFDKRVDYFTDGVRYVPGIQLFGA